MLIFAQNWNNFKAMKRLQIRWENHNYKNLQNIF